MDPGTSRNVMEEEDTSEHPLFEKNKRSKLVSSDLPNFKADSSGDQPLAAAAGRLLDSNVQDVSNRFQINHKSFEAAFSDYHDQLFSNAAQLLRNLRSERAAFEKKKLNDNKLISLKRSQIDRTTEKSKKNFELAKINLEYEKQRNENLKTQLRVIKEKRQSQNPSDDFPQSSNPK